MVKKISQHYPDFTRIWYYLTYDEEVGTRLNIILVCWFIALGFCRGIQK